MSLHKTDIRFLVAFRSLLDNAGRNLALEILTLLRVLVLSEIGLARISFENYQRVGMFSTLENGP